MKYLKRPLIALDVLVQSPEEAIREAGKLLVESELVEPSYVDAMVNSFKKNGPYFVIAPNIALPHARPEDGVNEACVSLIRLAHPIHFGHFANDPVQLVFALGASSSEEHLKILQNLTALLGDTKNVDRLLRVQSYEEIHQLLEV
ncbi:PTS sugar transporter subunit IIA [Thermoactinomyces mirandus]|uniref:PTS sugar transporter subunit IIA n=1 Tax=Thermoactinomyces mirandus TaxID=2756294 RepID=A0A7W1XQL0_9BACL|nr:PTS sugar transporter subunit IIA [Thermoactinomyces mirandus]MBA4601458.1 PTS sugar transporter subunit IIA [Thermoactinomyces mirandus]